MPGRKKVPTAGDRAAWSRHAGLEARAAAARPSAWRISLVLAITMLVSIAGLHSLVQGFGWWFPMAGTVLAVLGAAALARAVGIRPWVPTVAAVLTLLVILVFSFARSTALLFVVPTFGTLARFGDLGQAGALSISSQSVPAEVTFGVQFLLTLGVGALAIVADLLAVSLRRPVLAGIPLAILLGVPALVSAGLSDVFILMLGAIGWLVLLRAGDPLRQTGRAIGLGAIAVLAALVIPLVLPPAERSAATLESFHGYIAGVNPVLDLGADLRRPLPRTILRYNTLSGAPAYLRLVSLQNFTAETWEPDPPEVDRRNLPSSIAPAPGLSAQIAVTSETTWIDVQNLGSPWLPVPYPVTSVSGLRGDWYWEADDLTLTTPKGAARGEEYRASSEVVQPTPQQLFEAGAIVPPGMSQYLDLPEGLPEVIGSTAETVAGAATSNYEKAVALQEFFRNGQFRYSTTAPVQGKYDGNGMTVLATFLDAKSGYCIHFASAMAVMARTLGIPSRVAVGFLPGEKESETVSGRTSYRVTTSDVHSWPELYFEGIGWTRFEPTPGLGFVPVYADRANPEVPLPRPAEPSDPAATATPKPTPTAIAPPVDPNDPASKPGTATASLAWLWPTLVLLGAALVLLAPALVRRAQRGLRLARLSRGAAVASTGWRELVQSAQDLGIVIAPTATPRAAAAVIARAARLSATDSEALTRALHAVERESFARPLRHGSRDRGELAALLGGVIARMRASAPPRRRARASLFPPSIWRFLRALHAAEPATTRAG